MQRQLIFEIGVDPLLGPASGFEIANISRFTIRSPRFRGQPCTEAGLQVAQSDIGRIALEKAEEAICCTAILPPRKRPAGADHPTTAVRPVDAVALLRKLDGEEIDVRVAAFVVSIFLSPMKQRRDLDGPSVLRTRATCSDPQRLLKNVATVEESCRSWRELRRRWMVGEKVRRRFEKVGKEYSRIGCRDEDGKNDAPPLRKRRTQDYSRSLACSMI